MVIKLRKSSSRKEIKKALALAAKARKKKTLRKHFGKLKRGFDGLEYQKKMRNDWN